MVKPNEIAFVEKYDDGSGTAYAVRMTADAIQFEAVDVVDFPTDHLEWLIECLTFIRDNANDY